jgi:hypothetical protein
MIETLEDLKLESFEYAYLVEDTSYTADSFPLWMPKLLPLTNGSAKRENTVVINNNIFINEVKPETPSSVSARNYIRIPKYRKADFLYKVDNYPHNTSIKRGASFLVNVLNSNIQTMYVTDNI